MTGSLKVSLQKYAFGQFLSCILASTGLLNGWMYEKRGLNIPAMQAALTYSLILVGSIVYIGAVGSGSSVNASHIRSKIANHRQILMGSVLFDVSANWLVVKAFSELKIPEVMVFSGLSTPTAILIAFFLARPRPKYSRLQLFGVSLALSAIFAYFYLSQKEAITRSAIGITCAILSAISYAASNHFQERVSRVFDAHEFLLGLGALGSLISWVVLAFSSHEVESLIKSIDGIVAAMIVLYALILSTFYLLIPVYMTRHSAVSFNFSLLTANFLGIMASWWILQASYSNWLYLAVILINSGLLIYYIGEESNSESKIQEDSNINVNKV